MAIKKIIVEADYNSKSEPVLHKKCESVVEFDDSLKELIYNMTETLHNTDNAVGLAAPQIGILKRVTVIDLGEGPVVLINPEIVEKSDDFSEMVEGCLSYPGRWALVKRPNYVKVKTYDDNGKITYVEANDFLAKAFCHEMDHLDGIVFLDKATKEFSKEEIEELIAKQKSESSAGFSKAD